MKTLRNEFTNGSGHTRLFVCAVILAVAAAYPLAMNPGWHEDDYNQVFGTPLTPVLRIQDALKLGGMGSFSPARLLNFPYMGYGGWLLGERLSNAFQASTHLACVALFVYLLTRLGWGVRRASVAGALFGCAPWLSQSVYWWAAASVPVESLLVLAAFHAHLSWRAGGTRATHWLVASLVLQFIARLFYESWLVAPITILAIEVVLSRGEELPWRGNLMRSIRRTAVHLIPYAVWAGGFLLVDDSGVRQPSRDVVRFFISLVSVHARMLNWFTDIAWVTVLRDGLRELGLGPSLAAIPLALAAMVLFRIRKSKSDPGAGYEAVDWLSTLILAVGFYWGSRLVFTLGGGIDTLTRHHYGGSMGLAIFVAAALEALVARAGNARRVGLGLEIAVPVVLAVASLGVGVHYRETARAEEITYEMLVKEAIKAPKEVYWEGGIMVVVGRPTRTRGELAYYELRQGMWLEYRLNAIRKGIRAYAVEKVEIKDGVLRTPVNSRQDWTPPIRKKTYTIIEPPPVREKNIAPGLYMLEVPLDNVMLFEWKDGELQRVESPG